jgi:hypothetical protein
MRRRRRRRSRRSRGRRRRRRRRRRRFDVGRALALNKPLIHMRGGGGGDSTMVKSMFSTTPPYLGAGSVSHHLLRKLDTLARSLLLQRLGLELVVGDGGVPCVGGDLCNRTAHVVRVVRRALLARPGINTALFGEMTAHMHGMRGIV